MSNRQKKGGSSSHEGDSPVKQKSKRRKMAATGVNKGGEEIENGETVTLRDLQGQLHAIIGSLQELNCDIKTVKNKHEELDNDINGSGGIADEMEEAKAAIGETQADVSDTQQIIQDSVATIKLLTSVVLKQNQQLGFVQREIEDLKARSMRENILIHNVPEGDSQGVLNAAINFLKKANIDISHTEFDRIHRLGPIRSDKSARPIVAKPHKFRETERLLNLDKRGINRKTTVWISPQYPEHIRETRIQLAMIADEKRKLSKEAKIRISHTTLTINGQIVKPTLTPPSPADILTLDKEEKQDLKRIQFVQGTQVNYKSSSFRAQATIVKNLNDVRNAYKATMMDPEIAKTTHNIAAYILPNGSSGYCDDRDYGLGRRALQVMQSLIGKPQQHGTAIFISRQYGGTKLGTQRFEVVKDITTQVYIQLQKVMADDIRQTLTPTSTVHNLVSIQENEPMEQSSDGSSTVPDTMEDPKPGQSSEERDSVYNETEGVSKELHQDNEEKAAAM